MKNVSFVCLHVDWDRVQRYCGNVMVHNCAGTYVEVVVQLHLILTFCIYSFGYFPGEIPKRIYTVFKSRRKFEI